MVNLLIVDILLFSSFMSMGAIGLCLYIRHKANTLQKNTKVMDK